MGLKEEQRKGEEEKDNGFWVFLVYPMGIYYLYNGNEYSEINTNKENADIIYKNLM